MGDVIRVDFKKVKTDEELRQQALDIIALAIEGAPQTLIYESSLGFTDNAPCEYLAPETDPA